MAPTSQSRSKAAGANEAADAADAKPIAAPAAEDSAIAGSNDSNMSDDVPQSGHQTSQYANELEEMESRAPIKMITPDEYFI